MDGKCLFGQLDGNVCNQWNRLKGVRNAEARASRHYVGIGI